MSRWYAPSQDRTTPAERIEQHRQEQQAALLRREEMAKQVKTPTGIVRKRPDREGAEDSISSTHRALTDALKTVEEHMGRERSIRDAEQAERVSDARRQPRSPR